MSPEYSLSIVLLSRKILLFFFSLFSLFFLSRGFSFLFFFHFWMIPTCLFGNKNKKIIYLRVNHSSFSLLTKTNINRESTFHIFVAIVAVVAGISFTFSFSRGTGAINFSLLWLLLLLYHHALSYFFMNCKPFPFHLFFFETC